MKNVEIRKIQLLADSRTNHPIYYCHSSDIGHSPHLLISFEEGVVRLRARNLCYKVKLNPQGKNRVDMYMSVEQAVNLALALVDVADTSEEVEPLKINFNPGAKASGNMQLPQIHWTRSARYIRAAARTKTGTVFSAKANGSIYIDLETPDATHIRMVEKEVHIGVDMAVPNGTHDIAKAVAVTVPDSELQRGRNEKNPIMKTEGDFFLEISGSIALGLGRFLLTEGLYDI